MENTYLSLQDLLPRQVVYQRLTYQNKGDEPNPWIGTSSMHLGQQ